MICCTLEWSSPALCDRHEMSTCCVHLRTCCATCAVSIAADDTEITPAGRACLLSISCHQLPAAAAAVLMPAACMLTCCIYPVGVATSLLYLNRCRWHLKQRRVSWLTCGIVFCAVTPDAEAEWRRAASVLLHPAKEVLFSPVSVRNGRPKWFPRNKIYSLYTEEARCLLFGA